MLAFRRKKSMNILGISRFYRTGAAWLIWWLTPIVRSILILGALVFLGGTGAAPFIHTTF